MHSAIGKNKIYRCTKSIILPIKQKEKAALPNGRTAILDGINTMFIYNCIVNETAALEWFGGNFLQLYLKYKKMYSGIVAQNLQLYRKYEILVCKGIYNYIVNKEKFTVQIVFV